jgi:hypothetical protein
MACGEWQAKSGRGGTRKDEQEKFMNGLAGYLLNRTFGDDKLWNTRKKERRRCH